jgi:ATP-dependent DNA helicase RecQ
LTPGQGRYPTLQLSNEAVSVLKGEQPVVMLMEATTTHQEEEYNLEYFQELRGLRKMIADEKGLPPYVIFSDATLKEFSIYLPENKREMLAIKGVGEQKYEQYGERFLELIKPWSEQADSKPKPSSKPSSSIAKKDPTDERPSHIISFESWDLEKKSIAEIASERGLSKQTVESHLLRRSQEIEDFDWGRWFDEEQEKAVLRQYEELEEKKLKPLKEGLSENYTYSLIKAVLYKHNLMK